MKYRRFLATLFVFVTMLSLAACGETPAVTETTPPAATIEPIQPAPEPIQPSTDPVQPAAEETNYQDAAYYDSESGVVIWQWPQAFRPYAYDHFFQPLTVDQDGEFSGIVLNWTMENPEDPSGHNFASYAVVFGSSNPSATQENMEKQVAEARIFVEGYMPIFEEISTKSGQKIWVCHFTNADGGMNITGLVTPEQQAAYEAIYENLDALLAEMEFVKPVPRTATGNVVFSTVDLDGKPVNSSVLANAEYTMINVWASFCSPCIGEMEDLMKMDAEMDNVQIITILGDARSPSDDTAEDAREVVQTLNLTLPVYLTNDEIDALFPVDAFPTSFLVDREGNPLGTACVGAIGPERYQAWIQSCIDAQ